MLFRLSRRFRTIADDEYLLGCRRQRGCLKTTHEVERLNTILVRPGCVVFLEPSLQRWRRHGIGQSKTAPSPVAHRTPPSNLHKSPVALLLDLIKFNLAQAKFS